MSYPTVAAKQETEPASEGHWVLMVVDGFMTMCDGQNGGRNYPRDIIDAVSCSCTLKSLVIRKVSVIRRVK